MECVAWTHRVKFPYNFLLAACRLKAGAAEAGFGLRAGGQRAYQRSSILGSAAVPLTGVDQGSTRAVPEQAGQQEAQKNARGLKCEMRNYEMRPVPTRGNYKMRISKCATMKCGLKCVSSKCAFLKNA